MKMTGGVVSTLAVSLLVLGACAKGDPGAQGPQGPKGDTGPAGGTTASVSAISPLGVFTGRDYEIQISGNNTSWTASTTINFGQGITVNKVVAASATALVAQVTVAPDATSGPRDITIADTNMDAFKGAFHVDQLLSGSLTGGTLAQGSVVFGSIESFDVDHPFDTTQTGDGFFVPISYPNVTLDGGTGFTMNTSKVRATSIDYSMLIDVTAPTSPATVTVISGDPTGPASGLSYSVLPNAFSASQRSPMAITAGMTPITTTQKFESALLGIAPAAMDSLDDIMVTSTDTMANGSVYVIPKSGKWDDLLGSAPRPSTGDAFIWIAPQGDAFSAVLFDNSGEMTTYNVVHTSTVVGQTVNEAPGATTIATAQQVDALPFVMKMGDLANPAYQHVLRLSLTPGDVGKKIHAGTVTAGDRLTDTVVEVLTGADGGTSLGASDDSAYLDDFVTPATTAAGEYWVVITASSFYDPAHRPYNLFIRLEP